MHTSSPKVTCGRPGLHALTLHCFLFLCRFPSGLHSEVWNQGHLDVVCAPPLQGEPHPGPSGHWGSGWYGKGKAGNLLYSLLYLHFNFPPLFNFYDMSQSNYANKTVKNPGWEKNKHSLKTFLNWLGLKRVPSFWKDLKGDSNCWKLRGLKALLYFTSYYKLKLHLYLMEVSSPLSNPLQTCTECL